MYKPGKEAATRVEFRSPDPATNPYLAFSVMLAAGLAGIANKKAEWDAYRTNVTQWEPERYLPLLWICRHAKGLGWPGMDPGLPGLPTQHRGGEAPRQMVLGRNRKSP